MSTLKRMVPVVLCAVALSSCVPAEGEDEFGENSAMAAIQAAGVLRVGVPPDRPPFASGEDLEAQGFVVDLAQELADDLGVDLEVSTIPPVAMHDAVGGPDPGVHGDGSVDVAFNLEPLTQELFKLTSEKQGFEVTTPFYLAHQRLLVGADASVEELGDLSGKSVCSLLHPVASVDLEEIQEGVQVEVGTAPSACAERLMQGSADAVTALDDVLLTTKALLGNDAPPTTIVGDQLATAGYPVLVDKGMAGYVSGLLNEIEESGAWLDAYNRWIGPLSDEVGEPPQVTLEDAASIYPAEIP
jgi:ABC-type amino acid transport substrate-binding protein